MAPPATRGTQSTVLAVKNVSKVYRTQRSEDVSALSDVSVDVEAGQFISLVGPSGCGKTTLLKICANLITRTSGSVEYLGEDRPIPPGRAGVVFQTPALLPWRTVRSNLELPATILRSGRGRDLDERIDELLDLVQLGKAGDQYPGELSGGMQQRVSIARALVSDPEVLFMDEPFGALDAMTREELNLGLQQIQVSQRKTTLFVTHNIQESVFLADRVVVMSSRPGRIVADIPVPLPRPRDLLMQTSDEFKSIEQQVRVALDDSHAGGDSHKKG
jgi:NitT/TauT family transport system ATP-binding protein